MSKPDGEDCRHVHFVERGGGGGGKHKNKMHSFSRRDCIISSYQKHVMGLRTQEPMVMHTHTKEL